MPPKILIVEDNPLHMKLMEMTLRDRDYTLVKAGDGEEALALAVRERPDLILMDIRLPKLSGCEVTKRLRKNPTFSDTPIIALTAHAMAGDRESVIKCGCDTYISKPVDTRQLPAVIREILLRRKGEPADGDHGGQ
ncbi:MAG: response regulator [Dehalococcoidales bacterium]|nr:response regulator [Dehalococcoidales bacterium]